MVKLSRLFVIGALFALCLPAALAEKRIFLRAGDAFFPNSFGYSEGYDLDGSRLAVAVYKDNGINAVVLYDFTSDTAHQLFDGDDPVEDSSETFSFASSVSMGVNYAVASGLEADFSQAHVIQPVFGNGEPNGSPRKIAGSGELLPNGFIFSVAEPAVASGDIIAYRNSVAGIYGYNVPNEQTSTIVDTSSVYTGTSNRIGAFSLPSAVSTFAIGFQAFSLGGNDGVLLYDPATGELTEEVSFTNGGSQPRLFQVDGTARAMYSGFDPSFNFTLFTSIDGGTPFVSAGDPVAGGGEIGQIRFLHTASSASFPGGGGFCGFFNATLAAEPFGEEHLMRSCMGPAPGTPETEVILSPGEVVDGFVVESWTVAPEAADDRNIVVLVFDDTSSRALLFIGGTESPDSDDDGVADDSDNCTLAPNPGQQDTDGDGLGNACDADLSQDCRVNFADLAAFKSSFAPAPFNPDADFNSDGLTNFADLAFFRSAFAGTPGPSGLPNLCE